MDFDYENDSEEIRTDGPAAETVPPDAPPTLPDELREASRLKQEAAAPFAANRLRERARLDLENLTWLTVSGREIPARWTVFAESYYEVLSGAAGLNGDDDGTSDDDSGTARLYLWMWLATHNIDVCLRRDPEHGLALKDSKSLWLRTIFEWAEKEFPMGPDHFARREAAGALRDLLLRLSYATRAEVMESLEPQDKEEDEPGNQPAPRG